jgi:phage shock protein PspC (stress-responsive transcriptional regulator)
MEFSLEIGAYNALDAYISSLRAHFANDPDHDEIIRDIEARIAEKLLESKQKVITHAQIDAVIAEMGSVSRLQEEETSNEHQPEQVAGTRKLYRDGENAIIGGVAAGIAQYLGIDPVIIRILFILSVFAGGFGILMYLALWLLLPAAETASQKLEMRGEPVTLDSVTRTVKDRVSEAQERGIFSRILYFPFEVIGAVLRTIGRLLPVLGKLIGVLVALGSFMGILGATVAAALALANFNAAYIEIPLRDMVSHSLVYAVIIAGYFTAVIPLILLLLFSTRLLGWTRSIPAAVGFGLVGLWSLTLIALGVTGTRIAGEYFAHIQADPSYAEVTEVIEVDSFSQITVDDTWVRISEGDTYTVTFEGARRDVERMEAAVTNGILSITEKPLPDNCFLCDRDFVTIRIQTPSVDRIDVNGGWVILEDISEDSLHIDAEYGGIEGTLDVGNLTLNGSRTRIELGGNAAEATIVLDENARLSATGLTIENADITALDWSDAELNVTETLTITTDERSSVTHIGGSVVNRTEPVREETEENF